MRFVYDKDVREKMLVSNACSYVCFRRCHMAVVRQLTDLIVIKTVDKVKSRRWFRVLF